MNRKVFIERFLQPITIVLIVLVTQALFLTVTADIGLAQQFSTSAAATPISSVPGGPSSIELKRNWLLQQQATLNQSITVAKACIKNNSMSVVLRDPQGNIRIVPSTDVVNCNRTLNALLNRLAANQRAISNLSQDSQLAASKIVSDNTKLKLKRRLNILQGLPANAN
ncbi:MAG: hypothetical protein WC647_17505 [Desulfomonilaceae bacterium]|jgi:hypothetical protein